ncbi:unnamed protein product [Pleuronectes platessa]|uniref:Uncharacterized protein n=1 Tax=Pleuronectes platessa TaxID=8262 RepID=A0A9N7UBD5_PLEPL|nr:unnamed protein product [Pleuronectes platessa]
MNAGQRCGRDDEITASIDERESGEEQDVSGGDGRNIEVDKEGGILERLHKTCDKNINADEAGPHHSTETAFIKISNAADFGNISILIIQNLRCLRHSPIPSSSTAYPNTPALLAQLSPGSIHTYLSKHSSIRSAPPHSCFHCPTPCQKPSLMPSTPPAWITVMESCLVY